MNDTLKATVDTGPHDLVLSRHLDAPRAAVWRAWSEPELMRQWFAPRPWTVSAIEIDHRPGGTSRFVMRSPEGQEFPNDGVYLEVVPGEKIVFTDAYAAGWIPSAKPFMTAVVTLSDEDGGTRYVATVRHWTAADRDTHEKMGFDKGWGLSADQLEHLARSL